MAQIADIIKYEGDNSTFVWKHPLEDFNSMTQLIVHESQEAVFFMNGQALDLFVAGRYTLETQNVPKIGKLLNRAVGDQTPFHCEVYFVNKSEQMSIKWGTDSKVQYVEPLYGFPLSIGACGEMSLRAHDTRKLLLKLVGTENYLSQARLVDYFRALLMTKIKSYVAQTMKAKAINIFEIDENLDSLSKGIKELLIPDFADYGIALEKFWVTNILKPDGDPQFEKFKELHFRQYADIAEASLQQRVSIIQAQTEAQKTVIESQAMATKRTQEGYSYQQERGFDVMSDVAKNEGSGSDLRNAAMGVGIGFGFGGPLGSAMGNIVNDTMGEFMKPIGSTGTVTPETKDAIPGMISLNAEKELSNEDDDMAEFDRKLKKLVKMRDAGVLSDEEFTEQKNKLLSKL